MSRGKDEDDFDPNEISKDFWRIISEAKKDANRLRAILMEFSKDQIVEFQEEFVAVAAELAAEAFVAHMDPEESEDGIEDIAHWVVSQGKDVYLSIWNDPAKIPRHIDVGDKEILYGVADEVHLEKFGATTDVY